MAWLEGDLYPALGWPVSISVNIYSSSQESDLITSSHRSKIRLRQGFAAVNRKATGKLEILLCQSQLDEPLVDVAVCIQQVSNLRVTTFLRSSIILSSL